MRAKMIAISGKAGHGKDTVAKILKEELERRGYKVLICHYADALKAICREFFGWNGEKDESGRHMLQYYGTDIIRNKSPDFWVDFLTDLIRMIDEWDFVIVPDCRFPNEIRVPNEKGFNVCHLYVSRPNYDGKLTNEQRQHESELAMDSMHIDYAIPNNGDLKDLRKKILIFMEDYPHGLL